MGCDGAAVPACLSDRIDNTDKPESYIEMEPTVYAMGRVSCCDELGTIRRLESRADLGSDLPLVCDSILWHWRLWLLIQRFFFRANNPLWSTLVAVCLLRLFGCAGDFVRPGPEPGLQ
jgi:hypothetical protein